MKELQALWYVMLGVIMLGVGALFSDLVTGAADKLWNKKDPS